MGGNMNLDITQGAKRVLNANPAFSKKIYKAVNEMEIVLDQCHFKGNVVVGNDKKDVYFNIEPLNHIHSVNDLCSQLEYLIKCNNELNFPLYYKGEIFRYQSKKE